MSRFLSKLIQYTILIVLPVSILLVWFGAELAFGAQVTSLSVAAGAFAAAFGLTLLIGLVVAFFCWMKERKKARPIFILHRLIRTNNSGGQNTKNKSLVERFFVKN